MQNYILIIEDDDKVGNNLVLGLKEAGYSVQWARNGENGLAALLDQTPDAVLLDLNLPGRDGIEILSTIRKHYEQLPVLILSARDTVEERVLGLESGADDYLVKPFAFSELLARLKVMLRREQKSRLSYSVGGLLLDIKRRLVYLNDTELDLTPREFDILELLMKNQGLIVSRQTIARDVWKQVQRATPLDNVIDVHMMRLRKKIGQDQGSDIIQTVRGVGFTIKHD